MQLEHTPHPAAVFELRWVALRPDQPPEFILREGLRLFAAGNDQHENRLHWAGAALRTRSHRKLQR